MIKVRATQTGFYQCLRKAGETFDIPEDLFSGAWMEPVSEGTGKSRKATGAKVKSRKAGNKSAAKPAEQEPDKSEQPDDSPEQ